jgi:hypothetical protein
MFYSEMTTILFKGVGDKKVPEKAIGLGDDE